MGFFDLFNIKFPQGGEGNQAEGQILQMFSSDEKMSCMDVSLRLEQRTEGRVTLSDAEVGRILYALVVSGKLKKEVKCEKVFGVDTQREVFFLP